MAFIFIGWGGWYSLDTTLTAVLVTGSAVYLFFFVFCAFPWVGFQLLGIGCARGEYVWQGLVYHEVKTGPRYVLKKGGNK